MTQMPNVSPDVAIATLAGEMRTGFAQITGNIETLTQEVRAYSQAHQETDKKLEKLYEYHWELEKRVTEAENKDVVTPRQLWLGFTGLIALAAAVITCLAEAGLFR